MQPIARIVKSYGTEGDVMVSFQDGISDILKTEEPVWLFYDGLPVPFYIQNIQFKGLRKAILHLEDIDSHSDAEEAAGKDICIDPAGYPELSATDAHQINEDGLTLEDLTGFTLLNQDSSTVGVISDIMDFSGNICLEIEGSGRPAAGHRPRQPHRHPPHLRRPAVSHLCEKCRPIYNTLFSSDLKKHMQFLPSQKQSKNAH